MASSTSSLIEEVTDMCSRMSTTNRNAKDLNSLLRSPHIEALAEVYDNLVAQNNSFTDDVDEFHEMEVISRGGRSVGGNATSSSTAGHSDSDSNFDVDGQEPSNALRVIGMRKNDDEPLGMTVALEGGKVVIARIMAGGLVDRQGLLHVGDIITSVNEANIRTPEDLMDEVRRSKGKLLFSNILYLISCHAYYALGSVTFRVLPSFKGGLESAPCYMRTLFLYDPSADGLLPCRELGLSFGMGEILEVVNQEDPNWWQARKISESNLYIFE